MPPEGDQALAFSSQLGPPVGPRGVSLASSVFPACCSAMTFNRVDVAQQLEVQGCAFF